MCWSECFVGDRRTPGYFGEGAQWSGIDNQFMRLHYLRGQFGVGEAIFTAQTGDEGEGDSHLFST